METAASACIESALKQVEGSTVRWRGSLVLAFGEIPGSFSLSDSFGGPETVNVVEVIGTLEIVKRRYMELMHATAFPVDGTEPDGEDEGEDQPDRLAEAAAAPLL